MSYILFRLALHNADNSSRAGAECRATGPTGAAGQANSTHFVDLSGERQRGDNLPESLRSLLGSDVDRYRFMMSIDETAPVQRSSGALLTLRSIVLCKGLQATIVYRLGHALMQWQPTNPVARFGKIAGRLAHFVASRFVEMTTGISIAERAVIGRGLYIGHFGGVIVGLVVMGDNCNISHGVTLGRSGRIGSYGRPNVADRVWIGPGAVLTGGISIGDDAVIGANAVVTRDVPARSAALGVPARVRPDSPSFEMIAYRDAGTDERRLASLAMAGRLERRRVDSVNPVPAQGHAGVERRAATASTVTR